MKDELYNVAFRHADRYESLARQAERAEDQELEEFFRTMRDENRRQARRARTLLAQRVAE